jgi:hypothetical protein
VVDATAAGLYPPPPPLVNLVVVVVVTDMPVRGVVDAAICGVVVGDLSEPSEMETTLVPPEST